MPDATFRPGEMSRDECDDLLRSQELGRLAYHLAGEVHIVPVNHALAPDGRVLFRTAEGSKLLGLTMDERVAFEVDNLEEEHASSVVVRGRAVVLEGSAAYVADEVPLRPWVGDDKHVVVAIEPDEVTGRRFGLSRPWQHLRLG